MYIVGKYNPEDPTESLAWTGSGIFPPSAAQDSSIPPCTGHWRFFHTRPQDICRSISSALAMIHTIQEVLDFSFESILHGFPPLEFSLSLVLLITAILAKAPSPCELKEWLEWHVFWWDFKYIQNAGPIATWHSILINERLVLASTS